jgi:hypothetical protein
MDITGLVKSLDLPPGFRPPRDMAYEDIRASALTRADLDDDVRGINASLDLIARTRGGGWPTGAITAEDNYVDLGGTSSSPGRGTRSPTSCATTTAGTSAAATSTRWGGGSR